MGALVDGSDPRTTADLLARLDALGIAHDTLAHPPVFTVDEARTIRGDLGGAHVKNLVVRDRRRRMHLVTTLADRPVDLLALGDLLGVAGRLSFASEERLLRYLGIRPGAVSPFAVVNDVGRHVQVVLDAGLLTRATIHLHPLRNDATTTIATVDLLRFLTAEEHEPRIVDFDGVRHASPDRGSDCRGAPPRRSARPQDPHR
ncbi:MAG: prolyl-tRNA synthetase associated domain-containing protein [Planctomycetes bacterium]|nr:prolyl-tRNA synthetase associated domain-containing protein [Planctomycetota bacterium]